MRSEAKTATEYLSSLPEERIAPMDNLYKAIRKNIPKGFSEGMGYGMLGWSVPHSLYPSGYHCDPKQPLPFMSIASQKTSSQYTIWACIATPACLSGLPMSIPSIASVSWTWARVVSGSST